ncbi:MAG: 4-hydroxy-tetrahydrodipicolinate reductase [Syntrophomonadaceae bacterium]|jgi:4-hydroxy-tetrahydrodipicolinate reductase
MSQKIRVVVTGAMGRMGLETIKAVSHEETMELVGAVDIRAKGETLAQVAGLDNAEMEIETDLETVLDREKPDVMVDFTNPQVVFNNAKTGLTRSITCVIGTTGLNDAELKQLERLAVDNKVGVAVVPNFAIGAVLMMKFAQEAAQYFPDVEIIELHHDQKLDAPSGTALKTVDMINQRRVVVPPQNIKSFERVAGCRGGNVEQIRVHSVRLPGLIAHQEVIFGGAGQCLKIRHDSFNREGFMQGVLLVIQKMRARQGFVYGMENLI